MDIFQILLIRNPSGCGEIGKKPFGSSLPPTFYHTGWCHKISPTCFSKTPLTMYSNNVKHPSKRCHSRGGKTRKTCAFEWFLSSTTLFANFFPNTIKNVKWKSGWALDDAPLFSSHRSKDPVLSVDEGDVDIALTCKPPLNTQHLNMPGKKFHVSKQKKVL